ncbi:UNVERIFIED_CONTAM: Casein kinase II subunit alpha-4, chloroplastic [Sesamum radiatum]|uniref:Casein kinase II subunit alpha-4, chloroplastic n=1 Tax=Sesamum radiatum TaxID=300843 RepID=A0AAW2P315_SESRA
MVRPFQFIVSRHHRLSSAAAPLRHVSSQPPLSLTQQQQQQEQQVNLYRQKEKLKPKPPFSITVSPAASFAETMAQKIGKAIRRPGAPSKARVYADVNVIRPKEYWDYESLTVQWGYLIWMFL